MRSDDLQSAWRAIRLLQRLSLVMLLLACWEPLLVQAADEFRQTGTLAAPEAVQAAAADKQYVYAVANTTIAKYDRHSGRRVAESNGAALHLNSAAIHQGKLYCAHSNYPLKPEISQIKLLDPGTMELTTFKDFGDHGGSLTWVVWREDHWWCNFAYYGDENARTTLVQFNPQWREIARWTYPQAVIEELGSYSFSGGIWRGDRLLVTGHDAPLIFRLRLPERGTVLELVDTVPVPFQGQGFAPDPLTDGLVGIRRAERLVVFAE